MMSSIWFRLAMVVSSLVMIGLGYSMIAYLDVHWARHKAHLQTRGRRARRTASWEHHKFWQGVTLIFCGFGCMVLWFA